MVIRTSEILVATVKVWMKEVVFTFNDLKFGGHFFMKQKLVIRYITLTAVFGGLAAILYCVPGLQFQLPFVAPPFMSIHLDDIPILLSSFAYGPLLGIFEILLKTLIKLPMTSSLCAGELGDMIYSAALIIPASLIYKKNRTIKGAILGTAVGLVSTLFFSTIVNLYTIFPIYANLYQVNIAKAFNDIFHWNLTSNFDPRIAILLLPFNLIKNAIVIAVTFIAYKPLRYVLEKVYK